MKRLITLTLFTCVLILTTASKNSNLKKTNITSKTTNTKQIQNISPSNSGMVLPRTVYTEFATNIINPMQAQAQAQVQAQQPNCQDNSPLKINLSNIKSKKILQQNVGYANLMRNSGLTPVESLQLQQSVRPVTINTTSMQNSQQVMQNSQQGMQNMQGMQPQLQAQPVLSPPAGVPILPHTVKCLNNCDLSTNKCGCGCNCPKTKKLKKLKKKNTYSKRLAKIIEEKKKIIMEKIEKLKKCTKCDKTKTIKQLKELRKIEKKNNKEKDDNSDSDSDKTKKKSNRKSKNKNKKKSIKIDKLIAELNKDIKKVKNKKNTKKDNQETKSIKSLKDKKSEKSGKTSKKSNKTSKSDTFDDDKEDNKKIPGLDTESFVQKDDKKSYFKNNTELDKRESIKILKKSEGKDVKFQTLSNNPKSKSQSAESQSSPLLNIKTDILGKTGNCDKRNGKIVTKVQGEVIDALEKVKPYSPNAEVKNTKINHGSKTASELINQSLDYAKYSVKK